MLGGIDGERRGPKALQPADEALAGLALEGTALARDGSDEDTKRDGVVKGRGIYPKRFGTRCAKKPSIAARLEVAWWPLRRAAERFLSPRTAPVRSRKTDAR